MIFSEIMVFVIVLHCIQSMTFARLCSIDADCSYGGTCNEVTRKCSCTFGCKRFDSPKLVCTEKRYPVTECVALAIACELQRSVVLKHFDHLQYSQTRNCKKIKSPSNEEFCADQSYCEGNGICLRKVGRTDPYCRCTPDFFGERCQNKRYQLLETDNKYKDPRQGIAISPVPIAATFVVSIAMVTTAVFYFYKRSPAVMEEDVRKSEQRKTEDTVEGVNIVEHI